MTLDTQQIAIVVSACVASSVGLIASLNMLRICLRDNLSDKRALIEAHLKYKFQKQDFDKKHLQFEAEFKQDCELFMGLMKNSLKSFENAKENPNLGQETKERSALLLEMVVGWNCEVEKLKEIKRECILFENKYKDVFMDLEKNQDIEKKQDKTN